MLRLIGVLAFAAIVTVSTHRASAAPFITTTYDMGADMLAMELSSATGVNPNGVWTYGGYDDLGTPLFTAFGAAQHLDNWGSLLPSPFTSGEFQGYGFDTSLVIPSMVINTTGGSISPCCGISAYAPGQIFVHSAVAGDYPPQVPPGAFNLPTVRFTAPSAGSADLSILFTKMHSGNIPFSILRNGTLIGSNTIVTGQGTSLLYANTLDLLPGETIDFVVDGRASASLGGTIEFSVQVPEPGTAAILSIGCVGLVWQGRRRRVK